MNTKKLLIIIFTVVVAFTEIYSQNFNDALRLSYPGIGSSARALGMGNAFTAISNDYSATFFNPAGLGLVDRMEFTAGLSSNSLDNNSTFFNNTNEYTNSSTDLNQIGFVFPFPTRRGSLVFAAGFNQTTNFNNALQFNGFNNRNNSMVQALLGYQDIPWFLSLTDISGDNTPINGNLTQSGDLLEEGSINTGTLSFATEVSPNMFVGATINVLSGTYSSSRQYYEDDFDNYYGAGVLTDPDDPNTADFETFYLNDILDWDIAGWDMKFGILYKMRNFFTIGATIKLPSYYKITESYFVDATSEFGTGFIYDLDPDILNGQEYKISTPFEYTLGGSFDVGPILLAADFKLIDYTQMEFTDGLHPADMSAINREIKDTFRSVVNYNLGMEYLVPVFNVKLRGGFIYQRSPYEGDPSKYDRKYVTAGLGFGARNMAFDIGYSHGSWEDVSYNYFIDGVGYSQVDQEIKTDNLVFTLTYKF